MSFGHFVSGPERQVPSARPSRGASPRDVAASCTAADLQDGSAIVFKSRKARGLQPGLLDRLGVAQELALLAAALCARVVVLARPCDLLGRRFNHWKAYWDASRNASTAVPCSYTWDRYFTLELLGQPMPLLDSLPVASTNLHTSFRPVAPRRRPFVWDLSPLLEHKPWYRPNILIEHLNLTRAAVRLGHAGALVSRLSPTVWDGARRLLSALNVHRFRSLHIRRGDELHTHPECNTSIARVVE